MPLIFRNAGAWGAGKGARLTSLEADGNVYDLDSRLLGLENNPPAAVSIDHFTVSGNALTIYLTNPKDHFESFGRLYKAFVGDHRPAATIVGVTGLAFPAQLVEIRAVAHTG